MKQAAQTITVHHFRTFSYIEDFSGPFEYIFQSPQTFGAYLDTHKDHFDLSAKCDAGHSLQSLRKNYKKKFFSKKDLVMLIFQESSGGTRHAITHVENQEGDLIVHISVTPGMTCDMAGWHILIEVERTTPIHSVSVKASRFDAGDF